MRLVLPFVFGWACIAFAAEKISAITGVWRAQAHGVPALVMTISGEGGELTGAILFYLIRHGDGQPPRAEAGIPEPLFHLKFDGKALEFLVSHRRSHGARTANDPPVGFRLEIIGPDEGRLVREGDKSEAIRVSRDK